MAQNEKTGRTDNFRKGAGDMPGAYKGRRFNDTDIYKVLEAGSYSLAETSDPVLEKQTDELIALVGKNQQPDGYLMPARTIDPKNPAPGLGTERYEYENTGSHELYNSGHLIDAGVAHFTSTGKRALIGIAIKNADYIDRTFGPDKRRDAPGHEVIEMALVRLARATNDPKYLKLSKFFLDMRGTNHTASKDYTEASWKLYNDRPYRQDDVPVVDQTRGQGHAVRAVYLYSAMADMAAMLKDPAYDRAVTRIWDDVYSKRSYITGGMGSVGGTEAFADEYVLPNRTAYTETCASVGALMWDHRMFLKSGEARYLDAFEQTLYNGFLSGVSIKGDTFFYQNPLEATAQSRNNARSEYFDVACCPANLARLMANLPELIYAQDSSRVYVNLFVDSVAKIKVGPANVELTQKTNYPWDGKVQILAKANRAVDLNLRIRVPAWLRSKHPTSTDLYSLSGDGVTLPSGSMTPGAKSVAGAPEGWMDYELKLGPNPKAVVEVAIDMPMTVRRVTANSKVAEDAGKAAIQRGPVVYAIEGVDNGGTLADLTVPLAASFKPEFQSGLLGGVTVLKADASGAVTPRTITAIPYFAWANRGRGEMVVWAPVGK
ncbi:MAG: beta-L-arabinofuranosidase domain-containing protein [Vicinamibacteria bacterium]